MRKNTIKQALDLIKIETDEEQLYDNWYVPNRKTLKMNYEDFAAFERARLLEFENKFIVENKYWSHYGLSKPKQYKQKTIYDK